MKPTFTFRTISAVLLLACLSLGGCSKDKIGENDSWIKFQNVTYKYGSTQYYTVDGTQSVQWQYIPSRTWVYAFTALNGQNLLQLGFSCNTFSQSPNGSFRVLYIYPPSDEHNQTLTKEELMICSGGMLFFNGIVNYTLDGGTMVISRDGDQWTISAENVVLKPNSFTGPSETVSFTYKGKLTQTLAL